MTLTTAASAAMSVPLMRYIMQQVSSALTAIAKEQHVQPVIASKMASVIPEISIQILTIAANAAMSVVQRIFLEQPDLPVLQVHVKQPAVVAVIVW